MFDINELKQLPTWSEKLKESKLPVYIYGMGDGCEKLLRAFEEYDITCSGIFSSDDFKREKIFHGFKLMGLSELEAAVPEFAVACAFGTQIPEVMERIEGLSQRHLLVFPETAVAGDEYFCKDKLLDRAEDIIKVYGLLSDELSKETFLNVLKFRITGDIGYLSSYSAPDEVYKLLDLTGNEIYADLGAYNGDTVQSFVSYTGGRYKKIYAVEPSRKNFAKCVNRCSHLENITFINAAVSDYNDLAHFSVGAGRQQSISDKGDLIEVKTLDSILNGSPCTFVKYDVEGEDTPALLGSRSTIQSFCPKLRTGIYHRPYDILDIPLLVHFMQPKYKLYMRRPRYYPAWDLELIAKQ